MAGCAADDLEWGPEGSLTRFIANENKKVIKAMLRSGWRPADPLDAQQEWWVHQKRDRYEKACVLVLQAYVRLANKVQLYVQDKQKQASEHIEAQALANVQSYRHYLSLQVPRHPPPGTGRGSWTMQAPGNHTQV
ncbi:hypothetical protein chiPu_0027282 [Chiloscyllium punctatum]|uniref:Uncharacterized protein n=1 Tax=Chiloscyllium punctatum TaxID=137246 RepID=A0A401TKB6_CHIPU|nr:hypothetical protein [Chiloscyllium punctatum]